MHTTELSTRALITYIYHNELCVHFYLRMVAENCHRLQQIVIQLRSKS